MTKQNELQHSFPPKEISKRALQGAGIALVLFTFFLLIPDDITYGAWILLPVITVSVGGALGGVYYSLIEQLRYEGSWAKAYATISSILVYFMLLWLSLVAALNVTGHWN